MTSHRYRTLLGTALAAIFVAVAVAQTASDDPSRLPAKNAAAKFSQPAKQANKSHGQSIAALDPNEKPLVRH